MPKALINLTHGIGNVLKGEDIPATFVDINGDTHPTDWERLLSLGVIDRLPPALKPAKPAADKPAAEPAAKPAHRGRRGAGD